MVLQWYFYEFCYSQFYSNLSFVAKYVGFFAKFIWRNPQRLVKTFFKKNASPPTRPQQQESLKILSTVWNSVNISICHMNAFKIQKCFFCKLTIIELAPNPESNQN